MRRASERLAGRTRSALTAPTASSCTATAAAGTWSTRTSTQVDALAKKGVGIVCIHYGVEVPKGPSGEKFLDWIGGYFETNWSVNPHWTAKFEKFPDHPISRGVQPFEINDEWYYHMRFREGMKGVTPILTALPPKESLSRGRRPAQRQSGTSARRCWSARSRSTWPGPRSGEGGGRGFGFTGGHDHWNWGDPNFRKLVLNAIVWCAQGEVPEERRRVAGRDARRPSKPTWTPRTSRRISTARTIRKKLKLPPDDGATAKQTVRRPAARRREAGLRQPGCLAGDQEPRGRDRRRHHRREAAVARRHRRRRRFWLRLGRLGRAAAGRAQRARRS